LTCIAFKAGTMAADTMLSSGNAQTRAQKIIRLPDGGVAGGCGQWNRAYAGLKYLADGGDMDARPNPRTPEGPPDIDGATLMIAKPDGSLWLIEDEFPAFPIRDTVASVGCGADAAQMAMTLGLSAVQAVAAVTRQDVLCGDPVQSMDVVPTQEYPGAVTHKRPARKVARKRAK
jgi:hypothetical protein